LCIKLRNCLERERGGIQGLEKGGKTMSEKIGIRLCTFSRWRIIFTNRSPSTNQQVLPNAGV